LTGAAASEALLTTDHWRCLGSPYPELTILEEAIPMETTLYSLTKTLVMPPGSIILLLLAGFFLVRGVLGRILLLVGISSLTLMSLPPVAVALIWDLEPYPALQSETLGDTEAEAILVLGGGRYGWAPEFGGDTVGSDTLQRLRYGARLQRDTGLPIYVTAGSSPREDPPLGRLMADVLEKEYGLAVAGVEDRSRTTWENAEFSAEMLRRDGIGRILLVTHAWHLPRAVQAFERAEVDAVPAPTAFLHREGEERERTLQDWLPSMNAFSTSYYALHEWIGRAWYQLRASGRPD
jgi:uncharacterized SAM-binding protein YcdF (DUF218 family)